MAVVCFALALVAPGSHALAADTPTPPKGHRVVDESHVLSAGEIRALADKLKAIEDSSGAQVRVLTVPTAGDEGIAPFANRVFVDWGIGKKGVDDGILIVLATSDRRVRIEVGRGLEGSVPDVIAKRITADTMGPLFKAGKYAEGFTAGIDALALRIDAKPEVDTDTAAPAVGVPSSELGGSTGGVLWSTIVFVLFALFAVAILAAIVMSARRRGWGSGSSYASDAGYSSSGDSSSSSSSDSNDSSGGGGDSAGGGSDSSY